MPADHPVTLRPIVGATLIGAALAVAPAHAQSPPAADLGASRATRGSVSAPAQGEARPLSLDQAVDLALEANLGLRVQRIEPQIQDFTVALARTAWTPTFTSGVTAFSQDTPANSFLSGGEVKVSDDRVGLVTGLDQLLPWGASYSLLWDGSRASTTNIFSSFDPTLRSSINAAFVQPLLRNFSIDSARQQLLLSEKNREISDVELREAVVSTTREVKLAYLDLVFAISSLEVQRQSLELAEEALRNNRTRVEVGTMAPIDVVEAEAEVARNDESVILAEAGIEDAQDRLRALIFDPSSPDFWAIRIVPEDQPGIAPQEIDIDAAVRNALSRRTDLDVSRKTIDSTDISIRYLRNQLLPQLDVEFRYGTVGLGGTELIRGDGFPGPIVGTNRRSFGSVLGDVFANDFPTWSLGMTIGYPIGTSSAEASLARARLERTRAQTQVQNLELQVSTEVRQAGRSVLTNQKRVDATRAARVLSERRLEAEQKKFGVGLSTSFLVFQAQRDLAEARNNELRATLDYRQSLVDFEAVQEAGLGSPAPSIPTSTTGTLIPGQQSFGPSVQTGGNRAVATSLTGGQR